MVWGGFCADGKTSLYVLPKTYRQDAKFKNKKKLKGMDWEACLDCFKKKMMPGYRKFRCSYLLQDKAPCHRHHNVVKYLADRGVEVEGLQHQTKMYFGNKKSLERNPKESPG